MKGECPNGHTNYMCRDCGHVGCNAFHGCDFNIQGPGIRASGPCGRCGSGNITSQFARIGELEMIRNKPRKQSTPRSAPDYTPDIDMPEPYVPHYSGGLFGAIGELFSGLFALAKFLIVFVIITSACFFLGWKVPLASFDGIAWLLMIPVKILGAIAWVYWAIIGFIFF